MGGGVVGLASAHYLQQRGKRVRVLESGVVGEGASWGNAGWVSPTLSGPIPAPGVVMKAVRSLLTRESAFYVSPLHALTLLPWFVRFARHCNSRDYLAGYRATLRLAEGTHNLYERLSSDGVRFRRQDTPLLAVFTDRAKAQAALDDVSIVREFGYLLDPDVLGPADMSALEPGLAGTQTYGFLLPEERSLDPRTLTAGLAKSIVDGGGSVDEHYPVDDIRVERHQVRVSARGSDIGAETVVLAAGVHTTSLVRKLGLRIPMIAGAGYSLFVKPQVVPKHCLYLGDVKVGVTPLDEQIKIAGTMELVGLDAPLDLRRVDLVARSASRFLAPWDPASVSHRWGGRRPVPVDGLPIIGPAPGTDGRVFLATGHCMQGITLAPATGALVAQSIAERRVPPALLPFRVERFGAR